MKLAALTLNQKLAIVAVALGTLALFSVPHPWPRGHARHARAGADR
ncbi:MAG: hypothetical protein IPF50_13755 [Proteobacteria bacterium]|nr:hypothetical protein [Pseudomonadota bacterium]